MRADLVRGRAHAGTALLGCAGGLNPRTSTRKWLVCFVSSIVGVGRHGRLAMTATGKRGRDGRECRNGAQRSVPPGKRERRRRREGPLTSLDRGRRAETRSNLGDPPNLGFLTWGRNGARQVGGERGGSLYNSELISVFVWSLVSSTMRTV